VGNPLEWSTADRVLLGTLIVLPWALSYAVLGHYALYDLEQVAGHNPRDRGGFSRVFPRQIACLFGLAVWFKSPSLWLLTSIPPAFLTSMPPGVRSGVTG
jgi:hypothetical protein